MCVILILLTIYFTESKTWSSQLLENSRFFQNTDVFNDSRARGYNRCKRTRIRDRSI